MTQYTYKKPEENWVIAAKKADFFALAETFGLDPVTIRLLVNRGVSTEEAIRAYLYDGEAQMHDPALMKDLVKAADIVGEAAAAGRKIVVSADYDSDGIFSGELLFEALTALGGRVSVKTPHRVNDGYGLNERIVREAADEGASVLLTCDNGISSFEAVELAAKLGLTCVVTDHHEVPYEEKDGKKTYFIPDAAAVVDPHQADCDYPYKDLCGCGVALKLVQLLYRRADMKVPDIFYEYAAIATVADVMPLTGENRVIVREGLRRFKNGTSVGLDALIKAASLDVARLTSMNIGFGIGPRFNVAGRLGSVDPAISLLRTDDAEEAESLAALLNNMNETRKEMTDEALEQAVRLIESSDTVNDRVMLVRLRDCHESIAGIVAGRLRERYNRPAFVFTETESCLKGSGRSIPAYHMYSELTAHRDLLLRYGGHAQAAGLSLDFDRFDDLRRALNDDCTLTQEDMKVRVVIDAAMPLEYITEKLVGELELLEPVGRGNEKPLFAEKHFSVRSAALIGKNRNVLKLRVQNRAGCCMDALLFSGVDAFVDDVCARFGEEEWQKALLRETNAIDLALSYVPAVNEYMGRRTLQIQIQNYMLN